MKAFPFHALLLLFAILALTSCSTEKDPIPVEKDSPSGTLTLKFQATPDVELEQVPLIHCSDEPDFCDAVLNDASILPVPENTVCTQQYGGPEYAELTGSVDAVPVSLEFTNTDGCQIARWNSLQTLLDTLTPPVTLPGGAA